MAETTQNPAGSYGERLQSARRAQMITVEDVAQELRLSTDAVSALEAGQIEMFGAHAHVVICAVTASSSRSTRRN